MLKILAKIPLYNSLHYFGRPRILPLNYTILVSKKCNSRCATCNLWKIKEHDDLSLAEWKKIFSSLGRAPYWITFSGGEPFLRPDLAELVSCAYSICRPKIINIPTNSLLGPDLISKKVELIVENCQRANIVINLSLDGINDKHDQIRGREGNFAKVMAVYQSLKKLNYPNLSIGIHSVISKLNFNHIKDLYDYVEKLAPDQYISEIAEERNELENIGLPITPDYQEYSQAIDYLLAKLEQSQPHKIGALTKYFRINYYRMVKRWLMEKKQVIPCYAGVASAQISSDGQVWPCCVRADNLGNLRQNDYDFRKIWFAPQADAVRKSIKNKKCSCPLANAAYSTMLCDYKTLIKIGWQFIRQK